MTARWSGLHRAWGLVTVFLLLQIAFFVLMLAAMAVPNAPIARHLRSAIASKDFAVDEREAEPIGPGLVDGFTDCVALTMGLAKVQHGGLVYRTVADGHFGACGSSRAALATYDGSQPAVQEYFRYWHGYTVVTRPLLATVGVKASRIVLWVALVASVAVLLVTMRRWWWAGAVALLPLLLTSDAVALPMSEPAAIAWCVALLGAALVWRLAQSRLVAAALIAGATYAFVDLLTNPSAAWALTAFIAATAGFVRLGQWRSALRDGGVAAAAWFVGYAGTWTSKWLLGLDVYGWTRVRHEVLDQIGLRASSGGVDKGVGVTTRINFDNWIASGWREALVIVVLVAVAAALGAAIVRRQAVSTAAVAAPVVIVPVWYELVRNQSQIHAFFTYRALPVACGIAIAAGLLAARRTEPPPPVPSSTQP
jgi:hypothetical protein